MFDQHVHKSETRVCPVTQVIEKTITPDKVVDMYNDAYEEAEKNILQRYVVKSNLVDFVFLERLRYQSTLSVEFATCIEINGKKIEFTHHCNQNPLTTPNEIAQIFIRKFSEYIASQIVMENCEKLSHSFPQH